MAVKPIPEGYGSVTPSLIVDGAGRLIDFMSAAFGGQERMRMPMPDGKVAHAEVTIGDGLVMVSDATPEFGATKSLIHLYVEDVDSVYKQALNAGAKSERTPEDQFYGDRSATVIHAFGNRWSLATHVEEVSEEEMMKRMEAMAPA